MNLFPSTAFVLFLTLPGCHAAPCRGAVYSCTPLYLHLERKTVIKQSGVPGAGNGLFALGSIRKHEVIGQYCGTLTDGHGVGRQYLAFLPECAPCRFIDGSGSGSHVTRINFAPSSINGVKTDLQNAYILGICRPPYLLVIAGRDMRPGEEIFCSYGDSYNYNAFMLDEKVQKYFCGRIGVDCSDRFDYEP